MGNYFRSRITTSLGNHSFVLTWLSKNSSLLGKDYVCGQVSEHIFSPNGGFSFYINKQIIPVSIGVPLTCKGSIYSQKQSLSQSGRDYEIIPIDLDLCSIRFFFIVPDNLLSYSLASPDCTSHQYFRECWEYSRLLKVE